MTGTVIVGASLGGLRVAEGLRKLGYRDQIQLIGEERHLPYDRPPLSKGVLTGDQTPGDAQFRSPAELADSGIEIHTCTRATGLDLDRRVVHTEEHDFQYDHLVIATGARPRTLPGSEALRGVHVIRTLDDAEHIRHRLLTARRVLVVGAGFIGAEVAASAASIGIDVTIIEACQHPLERSVGQAVGAACSRLHTRYGTKLRCGVGVDRLEGSGSVETVVLDDGERVPCDLVVVGIGVVPNTEWLKGSGLALDNGVKCDEQLQAAEDVYALGDVAEWHNPRYGEDMRIEHWTTTVEQAAVAAHNIATAGDRRVCDSIPYFWSDQYGHRIQFAGRAGADEVVEIECASPQAEYLALYRREDRVVGVLAIDGTVPLMRLRGRILAGADSWDDCVGAATAMVWQTEG